ncbi:hypothetical protein PDE_07872 [Penicillium oxalicum 114-2]|uniref:Uncharacterized protein n=1 Tax=Penicillium oxalicum (strain 114-2 / CGMCC 5302) TaxID=933388 RepID=S7ZVX9_PENO1|nr:hypothetical protein PDE_07872 [Penicillium oxalicum 114-2]
MEFVEKSPAEWKPEEAKEDLEGDKRRPSWNRGRVWHTDPLSATLGHSVSGGLAKTDKKSRRDRATHSSPESPKMVLLRWDPWTSQDGMPARLGVEKPGPTWIPSTFVSRGATDP